MTHTPRETCAHVLGAWTTGERLNEAGERMFVFQQTCVRCGLVYEERGAIIEERDQAPRSYARTQKVNEEPDS